MKTKNILILTLLLSILLGVPRILFGQSKNKYIPTDPGITRGALRSLYDATGGPNWGINEKNVKKKGKYKWFGEVTDYKNWYGITVSESNEKIVKKIDLRGLGLSGKLSDANDFGSLKELEVLILSNNKLEGKIPNWLEDLKNVTTLDLSGNELSGPIPDWIGDLENLEKLKLGGNRLTGNIPAEICKLTKLKELDLGGNRLTGEIPKVLENLTNMEKIELQGNQLKGVIPPELKNLKKLENGECDFRWNALSSNDESLKDFLTQKQVKGDWAGSQTVCPEKIKASDLKGSSFSINWKKVSFDQEEGGYEIECRSDSEKLTPVNLEGKEKTEYIFENLSKRTRYYIRIRTWTAPHSKNKNRVFSSWSDEIPTSTRGILLRGQVTFDNGDGVPEVEIAATNGGGNTKTGNDGAFELNVPLGWSGTITASRQGGFLFEPDARVKEGFKRVEKDLRGLGFRAIFSSISGEVTGYKDTKGVEKVSFELSGIDLEKFPTLKDNKNVKSDKKGGYDIPVPSNWNGTITPLKKGWIFYPPTVRKDLSKDNNTPGEKAKEAKKINIDFRAEKDFKFLVNFSANAMLPAEGRFADIYHWNTWYPELTLGVKLSRYFYLWSSFGFFSSSGASAVLADPSRWRQYNLCLGTGYYRHVTPKLSWTLQAGAVWTHYEEEALGERVAQGVLGGRLDVAGYIKISQHLSTGLTLGYLVANDTLGQTSINLGGLKAGLTLGLRY